MSKLLALALALCAVLFAASPAMAQETSYTAGPGQTVPWGQGGFRATSGKYTQDSAATPHPVYCPLGCAGPSVANAGAYVDGSIVTIGAKADAPWDLVSGPATLMAVEKASAQQLAAIRQQLAGTVTIAGTVAVSNLPAVQPISAVTLPLPAGAASEATIAAIKLLLGSGAGQETTLQSIKTLLGTAPAQDSTLQAIKVLLGASPAQDSTLQAIKSLLGVAPAQDASLQTLIGRINALITALGTPAQAGGSIANTGFGITGTLPAFATTPTVNLGTIGASATAARQDSLLQALGAPFQAGGQIGNPAFGAQCTVMPVGDAAWTVNGPQWLPCTSTGRVRVGLSSAAQVGGALAAYADLVGFLDANGKQQPGRVDSGGNQLVADGANAAFQGAVAMTPGTTYPAQRSIGFSCTVAGSIILTLADASSITLPVSAGWQVFPFAATALALTGSTAGTAYNLK